MSIEKVFRCINLQCTTCRKQKLIRSNRTTAVITFLYILRAFSQYSRKALGLFLGFAFLVDGIVNDTDMGQGQSLNGQEWDWTSAKLGMASTINNSWRFWAFLSLIIKPQYQAEGSKMLIKECIYEIQFLQGNIQTTQSHSWNFLISSTITFI